MEGGPLRDRAAGLRGVASGTGALCSVPSVVTEPAELPLILALRPLSHHRSPPCQPGQAALMDCLHYLPHHCLNIYQTIMYLVSRSGEGRRQEATWLWPDARVNYRWDKSPGFS